MPDVDHHGLFTFHQKDLAPDPADRSSLDALALAARCSASFPGAFEPSFVPIHQKVTGVTGVPPRPDMADFANMTRSHWAADGGLLANRPISPLLSTVFSRRATREVRRILAFVVPDGGVTGHAGQSPPADQWAKPPTLVQALKLDLDAQLSQSVASELQLIRDHNDQLTAASDLRRALAGMGTRLHPDSLVTPTCWLTTRSSRAGAWPARCSPTSCARSRPWTACPRAGTRLSSPPACLLPVRTRNG